MSHTNYQAHTRSLEKDARKNYTRTNENIMNRTASRKPDLKPDMSGMISDASLDTSGILDNTKIRGRKNQNPYLEVSKWHENLNRTYRHPGDCLHGISARTTKVANTGHVRYFELLW
jgi:hypothetical protein